MNVPILIRKELPEDRQGIFDVNALAFERQDEARLVDLLRTAGKVLHSLVAVMDEVPVAHALFSPVEILGENGERFPGAGLGPVAVLPGHQRMGIGGELIRAGLSELRSLGVPFVVVLGHPPYYPRFGFEPSTRFGIRCQWKVPEEAFMVMALQKDGLQGVSGTAYYAPEFEGV